MCGILGYSGQPREGQWGQTHRLIEALFLASEHRGRHATGFVARAEPYKARSLGGVVTSKSPDAASTFISRNKPWQNLERRRCSTVLGHVRWATHGTPKDNANNHPFKGRRGLWLVHNGVLSDHEGVCERRGLRLSSDCDSEAILRVVECSPTPAAGLNDALNIFRGRSSMAVAVYDAREDCTYLARNDGRPLWMLRLKHDSRWFYASTRDILLNAFAHVLGRNVHQHLETMMPLAAGQVYRLGSDGGLIGLPEVDRRLDSVWL